MSLLFPFHFDGHGVNDRDGTRIAHIDVEMYPPSRYDHMRRNPDHAAAGNLLATAPLLLECLERLTEIIDMEGKVDHITDEGAIADARAAIAQAHSLEHDATWDDPDTDTAKLKRTKGPTMTTQEVVATLPPYCFGVLLSHKEVIRIVAGETGFYPTHTTFDTNEAASAFADEENARIGVTKGQRRAMEIGSMFGWHVPAANPALWTPEGKYAKEMNR